MINSARINCQPSPRKPYKISSKTQDKLFKKKHIFTSYNNEWMIYIYITIYIYYYIYIYIYIYVTIYYIYNGHALKCEDLIAEILSQLPKMLKNYQPDSIRQRHRDTAGGLLAMRGREMLVFIPGK